MKFSKTNQFPWQLERDTGSANKQICFLGGDCDSLVQNKGGGGGRGGEQSGGRREREKKSLFLFPDAAWAEQPVLIVAYRWFCMFGLSRADKWPALAAADSLLFSKWRSWWGHVMTPQRSLLQWIVPYNNTLNMMAIHSWGGKSLTGPKIQEEKKKKPTT